MNNYDWLVEKLDAFIRKYYANQLLRGVIIFLTCLLFYFLTATVSEYYLYLPVWLRVGLDAVFIIFGLTALVVWVIIPFIKMARLGKVISHEKAAVIVGDHFPEISDKLLNILQLKKHADHFSSKELITASIDQKASQISVLPITKAIDLSKNKKYLPYLLPLVIIGIIIMIFSPSIFLDASQRFLQPTKKFEKPAPFEFIIDPNSLKVVRGSDLVLDVSVTGNSLPSEMNILMGKENIPMQQNAKKIFQYTFKNVTDNFSFKLNAAGFTSDEYAVRVLQKPILKAFKMQIEYPKYIGKPSETRNSLGDLVVPEGTKIRWGLVAEHTDGAFIKFGNTPSVRLQKSGMFYGYEARLMNDTSYAILLQNKESDDTESFKYNVQVIKDQYPVIQVQEFRDTVTGKQILLNGTAGDDYGITKVLFHYQIVNDKNQELTAKSIPLKISEGLLTNFQHYFDVEMLHLQPGQKLNYYVEAWDNDGVNGSKAARSEMMTYAMYNNKQIDSVINANAQQINAGLSNSAQQNKQLQNDLKEMQNKMLQSDKMDWEQQQSLQELANKQQEMLQQLENTKKHFEDQIEQSKKKDLSQDIRDKQEELKKQMDNLMNNELKEQIKKLQELMAKLNKENALQNMQQLEQENKLFNMDLERMKELMKKLEMQMRMEDMANKMDKLAQQQLDLKKQTDEQKQDDASLQKDQKDLKKDLDNTLKTDMKDMKDLNNKTKNQQDLSDIEKNAQDAQQNMQQSSDELGQQQNSKASKSQNNAANNLQQMASALRTAAGGMDLQQIDIDIKAVRQILTNLIRLSFDQEQLMNTVQTTSPTSQAYLDNQKEQNRLHDNSLMIRDSLFTLSKRLFKLASTVNKETTELEKNMEYAKEALEDRKIGDALTKQQFVMTRTNNLALMLNEMLSNLMQMQRQAMQQSKQKGSCQNPGGMKPKPGAGQQLSDIITQQQQLGNAMQQMENALQKKDGQGKPKGQEGKSESDKGDNGGDYGNAEQLARLAQQQASIRRQLQALQSLLNSKGMGNARELRELQNKMDKTETDLVNRRLNNELLLRQKEILTRLLEAEKSIREQEQDDKRSSKTPDEIARPIPPELQKAIKERQNLLENYKTVPAQLKPYYKNMVQQYYHSIGQ